jgi:hypothetical protein
MRYAHVPLWLSKQLCLDCAQATAATITSVCAGGTGTDAAAVAYVQFMESIVAIITSTAGQDTVDLSQTGGITPILREVCSRIGKTLKESSIDSIARAAANLNSGVSKVTSVEDVLDFMIRDACNVRYGDGSACAGVEMYGSLYCRVVCALTTGLVLCVGRLRWYTKQ